MASFLLRIVLYSNLFALHLSRYPCFIAELILGSLNITSRVICENVSFRKASAGDTTCRSCIVASSSDAGSFTFPSNLCSSFGFTRLLSRYGANSLRLSLSLLLTFISGFTTVVIPPFIVFDATYRFNFDGFPI